MRGKWTDATREHMWETVVSKIGTAEEIGWKVSFETHPQWSDLNKQWAALFGHNLERSEQ